MLRRTPLPPYNEPRTTRVLLAALLVGGCLSTGLQAADAWTPAHSMEFRSISSTALSPDGSLVAYAVRTPMMEGEKSEYLSQIWVATADGSRNDQFTRGSESCTSPAFSPDGRSLAFLTTRGSEKDDKKSQLWRIPLGGGEAEQLTEIEGGVSSFRWSPDGRQIAFLSKDPDTEEEKARKKEKRDVILVDQNFKYSHLYSIPTEEDESGEREPRRLTEGEFHVNDFDWAPDSQSLVYAHQPDPRINTGFLDSDLATVTAAGGKPSALVTRPGIDASPRFSPDGRTIAFATQNGRSERVGLRDLAVVPADGGEIRSLGHTGDRNASLLRWAADGQSVFYAEASGTARRLFELPIDGGSPEIVGVADATVASAISLNQGTDHFAHAAQSDDRPPEVFVAATGSGGARQVSAVNTSVDLPPLGRSEQLSWKSKDGLEIEGILTYPVGYEGGRVPTILLVHGGPAGVFSHTFTGGPGIYKLQVFAQNGYAVLRPNPRGSTGYGKDFRYANVEDWGYGDFEDLMTGVDEVIRMGVADEERLFLMGWSYGGYMTSFAVTRTARFRAASMGAGLPNLVSMVHTTDIPDYLTTHMGGELWDDYEAFEKHSAMHHIKNVETPTQVIHGAQDLRVPFTQGQEFYVALGRLGVPTEMIVYPRTPHGPREPKFLMDVTPRILDWFARHGGPPSLTEEAATDGGEASATGDE